MLDPFLKQTLENVQATQAPFAPGQAVIGGRFVLQRQLGQGGMGQVWLARDTTLDEPRALKFVLPMLLSDANARKRLRNEARLGTHLAHPRIVRVFDFAEETGGSPLAAIVMEFVEGRTLNELLAEQELGFFEPEQIESWINDIIEGLRYAHEEKQRYHLDIKPANVIIETATGRAKLLDFGISRSAKDTITRLTGQSSSGTLPYMSPQQLDGEPPCAADDVYGLGATIYELLTGTPPFFRGKLDDQIRSKDPGSMMERRRQNVKEGLSLQVGNSLSATIVEIIESMLAKKSTDRMTLSQWLTLEVFSETPESQSQVSPEQLMPKSIEPTLIPSSDNQSSPKTNLKYASLFITIIFILILSDSLWRTSDFVNSFILALSPIFFCLIGFLFWTAVTGWCNNLPGKWPRYKYVFWWTFVVAAAAELTISSSINYAFDFTLTGFLGGIAFILISSGFLGFIPIFFILIFHGIFHAGKRLLDRK